MLNAIFTAASRHLASLPQYKGADGVIRYHNVPLPKLTPDTALKYHNACIAYLIKLSSDQEHVRDENLLAAAVILRYYEEIDTSFTGEDSETFLHTFQIFVKAQANPYFQILGDGGSPEYLRPGSNGNVRENALAYLKSFQHAAFRVALRQETTIAFMKQRAVRLPLERWSILQGSTQPMTLCGLTGTSTIVPMFYNIALVEKSWLEEPVLSVGMSSDATNLSGITRNHCHSHQFTIKRQI